MSYCIDTCLNSFLIHVLLIYFACLCVGTHYFKQVWKWWTPLVKCKASYGNNNYRSEFGVDYVPWFQFLVTSLWQTRKPRNVGFFNC